MTVGWVWVDVLENQPNDALKYTRRFSLNLAWTPISRLDLVAELLTGTRVNKDLQSRDRDADPARLAIPVLRSPEILRKPRAKRRAGHRRVRRCYA